MLKTMSSTKLQIGSRVHTTSVLRSRAYVIHGIRTVSHFSLAMYRDATTVARYPRNLPSTVRQQDTARKEAREKRKTRKEEELLKKKEEIKRLKSLKMKDLRTRLERIGREGGKDLDQSSGACSYLSSVSCILRMSFLYTALQELDLDADWDPDAHDRQMATIYEGDGDMEFVDEDKPTWDDDIDIEDIVPPEESEHTSKKSKKKKKKKDLDAVQDGVDESEMDANVEPVQDEEWDGTEEMQERVVA